MPDRKRLVTTLWLASFLPLVLVVPDRTSGSVTGSSQPDCLSRSSAQPSSPPKTHIDAAKATDAVLQANAVPNDNEEEERADAPNEPRVSFLIPHSLRKVPDRQLIARRSILSFYPLRC